MLQVAGYKLQVAGCTDFVLLQVASYGYTQNLKPETCNAHSAKRLK